MRTEHTKTPVSYTHLDVYKRQDETFTAKVEYSTEKPVRQITVQGILYSKENATITLQVKKDGCRTSASGSPVCWHRYLQDTRCSGTYYVINNPKT